MNDMTPMEEDFCLVEFREAVHGLSDKEAKDYLMDVLDYLLDPTMENLWDNVEKYGLSPRESRVLHALQRAGKRPLTKNGLMAVAYSDVPDTEWPQVKIIDVFVCKIRKKLREANADFEIETIWGLGYRLSPIKEEAPYAA